MEIKNKTAIITGATGKLAKEIVLSLAQAGANCICIYNKNSPQAKKLQAQMRKLKVRSIFVQADLTVTENIEKIFAGKEIPRILINAASVFEKKLIEDISFEYIRQTFALNFAAAMLMTQKFVKLARRKFKNKGKPFAKIINVADIVAQRPPAGFSVYCASKAALIAATKALAKELAPNFTVNAVSPGVIIWPQNVAAGLKKKILAHIPAGRTGRPEEVASAVKFLIENDYITGQVIDVDGGRAL